MDQYRMIDSKDVSGFFAGVFAFFAAIVRFIFLSLRKNIVIAIVVSALVLGGWYAYRQSRPSYFRSEMSCAYHNLSKRVYGEMVMKLNDLLATNSYKALGRELQLTEQQAASIVSIEAVNMKGQSIYDDFSAGQSPFYIRLKTTDNTVFEPFQKGMLACLNSSPFRNAKNKADLDKLNEKIARLVNDCALSDTLLLAYADFLKHKASVSDSAVTLPNLVQMISYKEVLEDKLVDLQRKRADLVTSVELMDGFKVPDNKSKDAALSLTSAMIIALLGAIAAAVLAQFIRSAGKG